MRVTDTRAGFDEALWAQLAAEPVARVDSGHSRGELVVDVELTPGVDPRQVHVRREGDAFVLVRGSDQAVLYRMALDTPVGRPSLRRTPNGLVITAPLAGTAPVVVRPGLRPVGWTSRVRAALARFTDRFRRRLTGS